MGKEVKPGKTSLKVMPASHAAARFACESWHYSHSLPAGKLFKIGAWEDDRFIGVIIFSRGANPNIGRPYGLTQSECVELTRVALTSHDSYVTQIVALALRKLKASNPALRLVVSYADQEHGHHGGIYQAGNWVYVGQTAGQSKAMLNGVIAHRRTFDSVGKTGYKRLETQPKHKYVYPLDSEIRRRIEPLKKPFPKRVKEQAPESPSGLGGATPAHTLHDSAM